MVELKAITAESFLDAFHLELAPEQERFVSHPIRSLAQAYVYRDQYQPFGDASGVALTCSKDNSAARSLYEKMGLHLWERKTRSSSL